MGGERSNVVDVNTTRQALHKWGDLDAIYEVTMFEAHRRLPTGRSEPVTIKILDSGESTNPQVRYAVDVTTADGRLATGYNARTVEAALALVQWSDLDRPPVLPNLMATTATGIGD